jgi:hypothetical protein
LGYYFKGQLTRGLLKNVKFYCIALTIFKQWKGGQAALEVRQAVRRGNIPDHHGGTVLIIYLGGDSGNKRCKRQAYLAHFSLNLEHKYPA